MEMLNRATEDAAAFKDLLTKIQRSPAERIRAACSTDPEILAWNAEVDRKKAEKALRKVEAQMARLRDEVQKGSQR
jgi:putative NADPH-quinone reductase